MSTANLFPTLPNQSVGCGKPIVPSCDKAELLRKLLQSPLLPSPPTLALQIVDKTSQPECSAAEIIQLLSRDPAMCSKLLKTVNSAMFGLSRPVASVDRAVAIVGSNPLRSLVLGLTLPVIQMRMQLDEGMRAYWRTSLTGAIIARELARWRNLPAPEDEFVATLLRDLGMMVLRQFFKDAYQPVWNGGREILAQQQCDWEERHLGIDHAEVGAALLAQWGLPGEIVEPIRFHHHPELLQERSPALAQRASLLDLCGRLAQLEELAADTSLLHEVLTSVRHRYRLSRAALEDLLSVVRAHVQEFADVINVDIGKCPEFDHVLAAGCTELVRLAAESACSAMQRQSGSRLAIAARPGQSAANEELIGTVVTGSSELDGSSLWSGGIPIPRLTEEFLAKLAEPGGKFRVQHYRIERVLGRGAMGIVIKAHDPALGRHVALKFLSPDLSRRSWAIERFRLEAQISASIHHENVVSVYAVGELSGDPFMVMEYIEGDSLQARLDDSRIQTVADIARLGREIALGLSAAHKLRVIHRDIKPANILIENNTARARVTDFGLARILDHDFNLSQNGMLLGTPLYMSPEQADGKRLTSASDLFSLGSVLYTLCTRQLPFQAESMSGLLNAIATREPVPILELNSAIPPDLVKLIEKLHAKDPAHRVGSAEEVAEELLPFTA
jgi:HD-like signal output (HDOD) protein/predicted Ser/Thr protein kinase